MELEVMMTKAKAAYKWAHSRVNVIQSVFGILWSYFLPTLLSSWHWIGTFTTNCRNTDLIIALEEYLRNFWNLVYTTMTIEVISPPEVIHPIVHSTEESEPTSTILPTIIINSEPMEEYISSDDCDSGLVLTEPDDNELSSDDNTNKIVNASYTLRRDSDTSSDGNEEIHDGKENKFKKNVSKENVQERLIQQVELMFSDEHLAKDSFLLKHVRRRSDGFVSLKLVAGLRKVKQVTREFDVVLGSLRNSTKLEVNADGTKVRRLDSLTPYLKSLPTTGGRDTRNDRKLSNGASSDSAQDDRVPMKNKQNQSNGIQLRRHSRNAGNPTENSGLNPQQRPKSNSYCEGIGRRNSNGRMSAWIRQMDTPRTPTDNTDSTQDDRGPMKNNQNQLKPTTHENNGNQQRRNSRNVVYTISTPQENNAGPQNLQRPKSNSYCEGFDRRNSNGGMSLWLQRRMESSKSYSEGSITVSAVVRQPFGPDGTRGFKRLMI